MNDPHVNGFDEWRENERLLRELPQNSECAKALEARQDELEHQAGLHGRALVSLRKIENCVKLLPHMKDMSKTAGSGTDVPFADAILRSCKVFPQGEDEVGADVWWATPFRSEGKCFFAFSKLMDIGPLPHFYLDHFYTPERRRGYASKTLRMLCDLADYHKTALSLNAEAEADKAMSDDQLQKWYERYGFVFDEFANGDDLSLRGGVRVPKAANTR